MYSTLIPNMKEIPTNGKWALNVVTLFYWTPIFEWYMAKLVAKYGHQEDACY